MKLFFISICALIFVSCSVQKRHYTNGFYFQGKSKLEREKKPEPNLIASSGKSIAIEENKTQIEEENNFNQEGCDTIFLKDRSSIICRIVGLGSEEIRFKSCVDETKPVVAISVDKVRGICFSDGERKKVNIPYVRIHKTQCDTLVFNDGGVIVAKILSIKGNKIKFKNCDNPNGSAYTNDASEIAMIVHREGIKELITMDANRINTPKEVDYENKRLAPFTIGTIITASLATLCLGFGWFVSPGGLVMLVSGYFLMITTFILAINAIIQIAKNREIYSGMGITIFCMIFPIIVAMVSMFIILLRI